MNVLLLRLQLTIYDVYRLPDTLGAASHDFSNATFPRLLSHVNDLSLGTSIPTARLDRARRRDKLSQSSSLLL